MTLFALLVAILSAYALLDWGVLPVIETRWKSASNRAKTSRAGLVAGLKTLIDFLKVAVWVFGLAAIVLGILIMLAPFVAGTVLVRIHDAAAEIEFWTKSVSGALATITLWIALVALAYFAFRARRSSISQALMDERQRQFEALIEKAQKGKLEFLPPDESMQMAMAQVEAWDAQLDQLAAAGAPAELLEKTLVARNLVAEHALILDFDRRIDLTAIPVFDRSEKPNGIAARIRTVLFSRGMGDLLSGASKRLGRVGTTVACLLTIGVASPAIASLGIVPMLDRFSDIHVLRNEETAAATLAQIARAIPLEAEASDSSSNQDDDDEHDLYGRAAEHFLQAMARSAALEAAARRSLPGREMAGATPPADIAEEIAIRDSIQRIVASGNGDALGIEAVPLRGEAGSADIMSRYEAFRARNVASARPKGWSGAIQHVRKWLQAKGNQSPRFRERLRAGIASFSEPRPMWDFAGEALNESLLKAVREALPIPTGDDPFTQRIGKGGRKSLETGLSRFIRHHFIRFTNQLSSGGDYAQALRAIRESGGVDMILRRGEADHVRDFLNGVETDRRALALAFAENPPSLVERLPEAQRELFRNTGAAWSTGTPPGYSANRLRQTLEGSLGGYEDLFPSQRHMASHTPLGQAIAEAPGLALDSPSPEVSVESSGGATSADGGGGGGRASSPANRSRNFAGLRGSFRLGGVLIGAEPSDGDPLDYRDLVWTREGTHFSLALVGADVARLEMGNFSVAMIQQALAYAADGRPVTVTMTASPLTSLPEDQMLRVHIHPALVNTEIGCWFVELDRFVDEASENWSARSTWEARVLNQLQAYREAYRRAAPSEISDINGTEVLGDAPGSTISTLFPEDWRVDDARLSFFAHYPSRFDLGLVEAMIECGRLGDDRSQFSTCLGGYNLNTARYREQTGTVWSGVREREFALTPAAFVPQRSPPLRFMLQLAFAEEPDCSGDNCDADRATAPWEFPMLGDGVERRVFSMVSRSGAKRTLLDDTSKFTRLQRLFRAALRGHLGDAFPRPRLVELLREAKAAEPIRAHPTPQWSWPREVAEQKYVAALFSGQLRNKPTALFDGIFQPQTQSRFAETCTASEKALRTTTGPPPR